MQGTYEIIIENKKIRYLFTIRRNLTIIRGDSATGKTTLIDMVREYAENGADSGITLSCSCPCVVLEGVNWRSVLPNYQNSIVFIDEGNTFITSKEFASIIAQTNNYYVIATRDALPMLPYSVKEIYGIRTSNKYGSLKKVHNEMYHMYNFSYTDKFNPAVILTDATKDTPFAYKKAKINEAYLTNTARSKILHVDEGIMEYILGE